MLDAGEAADKGCELQVLVREFGEFDPSPTSLELVSEDGSLHRPKGPRPFLTPHAIERLEPGRLEPASGRLEIEIRVWRRAHHLASTAAKIPVELVSLAGRQRHQERVANGIAVERRGPA